MEPQDKNENPEQAEPEPTWHQRTTKLCQQWWALPVIIGGVLTTVCCLVALWLGISNIAWSGLIVGLAGAGLTIAAFFFGERSSADEGFVGWKRVPYEDGCYCSTCKRALAARVRY